MFRYERPQKEDLENFINLFAEIFGIDSVYEDTNIIIMIKEILEFLELGLH